MPRHYESSLALCPFYRMEEKTAIWCEGPFDSALQLTFDTEADKAAQRERRCCNAWTECPLARTLWAQYDELSELRRFSRPKKYLRGG